MQFEVFHQLSFGVDGPAGGHDVLETLTRIREHISKKVLPRFERFFS